MKPTMKYFEMAKAITRAARDEVLLQKTERLKANILREIEALEERIIKDRVEDGSLYLVKRGDKNESIQ
jgi:hypothetical protein